MNWGAYSPYILGLCGFLGWLLSIGVRTPLPTALANLESYIKPARPLLAKTFGNVWARSISLLAIGVAVGTLATQPRPHRWDEDEPKSTPSTGELSRNDTGAETKRKLEQPAPEKPSVADKLQLGPHSILSMIDSIATRGNALTPQSNPIDLKWALIITAPRENGDLAVLVRRIIGHKLTTIQIQPPDPRDIDAPKFAETGGAGIVLHGDNQLNDRLFYELGRCFNVRKTTRAPDGLQQWYANKIPSDYTVDWVEIGPGTPWREPFPCSE